MGDWQARLCTARGPDTLGCRNLQAHEREAGSWLRTLLPMMVRAHCVGVPNPQVKAGEEGLSGFRLFGIQHSARVVLLNIYKESGQARGRGMVETNHQLPLLNSATHFSQRGSNRALPTAEPVSRLPSPLSRAHPASVT